MTAGGVARVAEQRPGNGPLWLVIAWFALEYLRPQDYFPALGAIRPSLLMLVLIFLVWFFWGDKSALRDGLVRFYLLFIAVGVISILFARNAFWVAQDNMLLFSYLVGGILPLAAFARRPGMLQRFFFWWILFHALVALAGIVRGGTGSGNFMGDENDLALTMVIAIPFAYCFAFELRGAGAGVRFAAIVAGLLMVGAVIASQSRGGFLGLITAALAVIWFSRRRTRNLTVIALFGALMFAMVSQEYVNEMSSITDAQDRTRESRFYYWSRGWEMFLDNPVLGVGTGNYNWTVEEYERHDSNRPFWRPYSGGRAAHSIYFTLLPEYGLAGTAIFALLAVSLWRRLATLRRWRGGPRAGEEDLETIGALGRAASASLLAFLVSGAFLSALYYPHFWYLLGFTVTLSALARSAAPAFRAQAADPARRKLLTHV